MTLRRIVVVLLVLVTAATAGCAEQYDLRMKHLDEMTEAGIAYRADLLRQGTPISEQACETGHTLLQADIPWDEDGGAVSTEWRNQSKEAYMKGCLTGEPRPKPEPSGVKAVTPVPHGSAPGESGSPAAIPAGSPSS